jgi:hypothetical protein
MFVRSERLLHDGMCCLENGAILNIKQIPSPIPCCRAR